MGFETAGQTSHSEIGFDNKWVSKPKLGKAKHDNPTYQVIGLLGFVLVPTQSNQVLVTAVITFCYHANKFQNYTYVSKLNDLAETFFERQNLNVVFKQEGRDAIVQTGVGWCS